MADDTRQFDTDRLENDELQEINLVKRKLVRDPEADDVIEDTNKPLLDEGRLSKKQRLHLETVAGLADEEGFAESNEALLDALIPPSTLDYSPEPSVSQTDQTESISQSEPTMMDKIGPNLTYEGMMAASGSLEPVAVGLHEDESHIIAVAEPRVRQFSLRDLPVEAKIAIGIVALAVPLIGGTIYYQSTENAKVDEAQAREVYQHAIAAERSQSLAQRSEQPYRQAAPASFSSGQFAAPSASAKSFEESDLENWHPSPNKMPAPTPDEIAQGNRHIEIADRMLSVGKEAQAAAYLSAALGKCPANVTLRIATIKAYVAFKKYKTAHAICAEGMRNARTAGDFAALKAQLSQIPVSSS